MGTLEKVIELKKQGVSDEKIISQLKEEGINPMEINDSLNQTKIKEAVGEENKENSAENMQPSIMKVQEEETSPQKTPKENIKKNPPQEQEYTPQEEPYKTQQGFYPEEASPQQDYDYEDAYPEEDYNYQNNNYSSTNTSTETMIEIAEQVFSEKMKDLEKGIQEVKEFKTIYKSKIDDIDERVKRIEKMFDKMQIAILDKVGNFSKNIDSMQKEIEMVEDSITKLNKNK